MFRIIAVSVFFYICSFAQIQAQSGDTAAVASATDTMQKAAGTQMSTTVITKQNESEQSGTDTELQPIHPLSFDSSGIGALRINVYPEDAYVYLNTVFAGNGDRFIKNLKSGIYSVRIETKTSHTEDFVRVNNGEITQLDRNVERPVRFVAETSWAFFFNNNGRSIGPSADLGIQYKNHYFGIDYTWGEIDEVYLLGGAGLKYHYRFNFKDIVSIAPGLMGGFWYSNCYGEYCEPTDGNYDYYDYEHRMYFGGIGCKFNLGYKWVFLNFESSALFGTSVACLLKTGVSFKL